MARRSIRNGRLLTNSHWTATRVIAEGGVRPLAIIPSGFDPAVFRPEGRRDYSGPLRIVTVGRRVRWKGLADLITGLNLVDRTRYPFELHVISQEPLDLMQARFNVTIVKPSSEQELVEGFQWGDVYVHSSWFEGFGMPPLEAQACGLAVISTDCGGVSEFLRDRENCLLVPPREPHTLARAVERLAAHPEQARRLADMGLKTSQTFTWDKIAVNFEAALKSVLQGK